MVHVAEDGDDGWADFQLRRVVFGDRSGCDGNLAICFARRVAERPGHDRSRFEVDDLIDAGKDARTHQLLDDLDGLDFHPLGKRANGHRLAEG